MDAPTPPRGAYVFGAFHLDPARRALTRDGGPVALTPTVFDLLCHLVANAGRIVGKDELVETVWAGRFLDESNLTTTVFVLRKALRDAGETGRLIVTAPGRGYMFTGEVSRGDARRSEPIEPVLAVLAFDNLSADADMAYFSDGLSEEILQTVARGTELKVIGRSSSFQFRGAGKAAKNIAAELRATHALDGSVRRSGSRLRIAAHLVECAGGTTLWSGQFDRELTDVFALQDEIAGAVAAALQIVFAPATNSEAIDPAAHDLYLRAIRLTGSEVAARLASIELLEQATALAPEFARAWAALAVARAHRLRFDETDQSYALARGLVVEAAETALRLDPDLGVAYQALSELEPFHALGNRGSLHQKALTVSPRDPRILFAASAFSAEVGQLQGALNYVKEAHELDPLNADAARWYAFMVEAQGRYEESCGLWERFHALWPDSEVTVWNAIHAAVRNADWARFDSLVTIARGEGLYTPLVRQLVWFGRNLRSPDEQSMKAALEHCRQEIFQSRDVPLRWLISLCQLGFRDDVFDLIDQAWFAFMFDEKRRWPGGLADMSALFYFPNHEMLHDARFPSFCAKLGLCDYWLQTDRWPDCAEDGVLSYDFKAECRRLVVA